MKMFTSEGFLYQQNQSINAINKLFDTIGFPEPHWLQPYLVLALVGFYIGFFIRKFREIFHLTYMQV